MVLIFIQSLITFIKVYAKNKIGPKSKTPHFCNTFH